MCLDGHGIAVTGIACQFPGASDPRQFWENILTRRRQFRRMPDQRLPLAEYHDPNPAAVDKTYGTMAALLDGFEFDWVKWRIPKKTFESTDIVHWLALDVARRAFADAGYVKKSIPTHRTGVILGNTLTGEQTRSQLLRLRWPFVRRALLAAANQREFSDRQTAQLLETMEVYYKSVFAPITEDSLAGGLSNTIAGRICNYFDFHGGGYCVDGACSSSLIAIITAARSLSQGDLDLALAGGVDVSLDTFELIGFAKTGALTATDMRVYDRRASGFIPGEGCGFVVLKRLQDARADGDYIYATFSGWGVSSDGRGGITAPSSEGQSKALVRAYTHSLHEASALDFVEGHGTGTPVGDQEELKGVAMTLGDMGDPPLRPCGITSVKSIIGHTKASAGVAGFIKAVMAVNQRILPPTAGCTDPNPIFQREAKHLYPILRGEVRPADTVLRAGVSAMGFGGINSHVTLESADAPSPRLQPTVSNLPDERALLVSNQGSELFAVGADSTAALLERIRELSKLAKLMSEAEMVDLASRLADEYRSGSQLRAAIVARSPVALGDALTELERMLVQKVLSSGEVIGDRHSGVWLGHAGDPPRLGFLFPGQGSQQLNMARRLVERHPWAREIVAQVEHALQSMGDLPHFTETNLTDMLFKPLERARDADQIKAWMSVLTRTEIAQPALCLSSLLWFHYLERLGLQPTAVGGHSLGELTAFHAAGAFAAQALVELAAVRGMAMSATDGEAGAMASLACSLDETRTLLKQVSGYLVVSNINSPQQIIVSGEKAAVSQALSLANEHNILARELPVSNAFHSRFVSPAAEQLRAYTHLPPSLGPLKSRLLTSIDGQEVRPGLDLREHFARQILAPVDFVSLLRYMTQSCDLLLEVGTGRVLTGLVEATLGHGVECFCVESIAETDADLNQMLANYFAHGGEVNWETLYEGRLVRPFRPAWEMRFIENPCEKPLDRHVDTKAVSAAHHTTAKAPSREDLAGVLGIQPSSVEHYLARRGSFLKAVIKADMENFHDTGPTEHPSARKFDTVAEKAPPRQAAVDTDHAAASVSELLLQLVSDHSGFPASTLTPELRLLDDLNLDSIKAASLIAEAADRLGVAGQLEPSEFANASLEAIADHFSKLTPDRQKEQNQAAGAIPSTVASRSMRYATWVRDFAFEAVVDEGSTDVSTGDTQEATGGVLILTDEGERDLASALSGHLRNKGFETHQVRFPFTPGEEQSFNYYITLLPREPDSVRPLDERLKEIVERLHTPLRCLSSSSSSVDTTVVYVQFGGGYFGKGPVSVDVEQCCANALAASLHLERPGLKVRVLDFSTEISPAALCGHLWTELQSNERHAVAGYDAMHIRRVLRPRLLDPSRYENRLFSWSSDDVVLITGGAKGITAECAYALALETGVRLALVGSSALEPDELMNGGGCDAFNNLRRFSEAGLTAHYYQCNVANAQDVTRLITKVTGELGEITAVIHGAGLNKPAALDSVTVDAAMQEVSPKILGAVNLCQALERTQCPIKLFIGFSSIIGLSGMQRNGWYAFSNEALSLILAGYRERFPECAVLSLAFSIWDEVGMGARLGSTDYLARLGIDPIPVTDGVRRFLRLFKQDPGIHEVATTARVNGLNTWVLPGNSIETDRYRYLEHIVSNVTGIETIVRARLTLERDPYVKDHIWRGTHLFPAVFGLEAMAQAVALVTGESTFDSLRIMDVMLEHPIVVDPQDGTAIEIRAEVLEHDGEQSGKRIKTQIAVEQTAFAKACFSALFVLNDPGKIPAIELNLPEEPLPIEPKPDLYGWLLFQGDAFQRIDRVYSLDSRMTLISARTSRLADGATGTRWLLGDPYFRDAMLQSVQLPLTQEICLPVALERMDRYDVEPQHPESGYILTNVEQKQGENVFSTITAFAGDGRVRECISGHMRILEHRRDHPTPEALAAGIRPGRATLERDATKTVSLETRLGETGTDEFDPTLAYSAAIERLKDGRPVLAIRFPVTFREAANLSRTLHFSHYFSWIGKLRETFIEPVAKQLVERFASGEWGMVTNSAETVIGGEVSSGDVIEGRVWLEGLTGSMDSTIEMGFAWRKLLPNGQSRLIATGKMSSTWVALPGHGKVEVRPLPEFGRRYVERLLPAADRQNETHTGTDRLHPANLGRELFCAPPGPATKACLLKTLEFETSLEDANLVGNLYFANYSAWQGRIRDRYFHELKTEIGDIPGEFRCTSCRIDHLQEAMPFEKILLRMYLRGVHERGLRLYFDYFRLTPDGQHNKIAFAEQQALWYEPAGGDAWEQSELPAALVNRLLGKRPQWSTRKKGTKERQDVIFIGAGIGGLAAAALLCKRGRKVVILEQHNKPGGFCTSWTRTVPGRQAGSGEPMKFHFDAGVQDILGIAPGGNVNKLLRELGIADQIEWRRVTHEYILSDLRLKVPLSLEGFQEELASRFPEERAGLAALFAEIEACNRVIYNQDVVRNTAAPPGENILARWANKTFMAMLQSYVRDERLVHLLSVLSHYISDNPATLGALSMCPVLAYYSQGGYYPVGGAQVLPDRLASAIKRHGGEIRLHTPVSKIIVEQGSAKGVRLADGSELRASEIIANADVHNTYLKLLGQEHLDRSFIERIENLRPSCSAYMVLLGLDIIPDIEPLSLLIDEDGKAIQVSTLSKVDPSLAPPGYSRVQITRLIHNSAVGIWRRGSADYKARKQLYGDDLIRITETAIPNLGNHIVYREDASPATFARYAWTTQGAIYGVDMQDWRPSIKTPVPNLYMVGAGVAPRPGVEDAVRTGIRTANAIQSCR